MKHIRGACNIAGFQTIYLKYDNVSHKIQAIILITIFSYNFHGLKCYVETFTNDLTLQFSKYSFKLYHNIWLSFHTIITVYTLNTYGNP